MPPRHGWRFAVVPALRFEHLSWALRLLGLLVFPALFIFNRDLLSDAVAAVRDADLPYLLAGTALMLAASVARAARWRILAEASGVRYGSFLDYLSIYYAGLFLGAAIPQIAASFAPVVLMREDGHSWKRSTMSILFDRLIETAAILLVALVAALYLLPDHRRLSIVVLVVAGGGLAALIAAPFVAMRAPDLVAKYARGPLRKLETAAQMITSPEAREVYAGMRSRGALIAALSVLVVTLQVLVVIFLAESLGVRASLVLLAAAAAMVVLVVMLPVSIAGLGSREAVLVLLFTAAGEPSEQAVALGLLLFAVGLVARMPGALGWLRRSRGAHTAAANDVTLADAAASEAHGRGG